MSKKCVYLNKEIEKQLEELSKYGLNVSSLFEQEVINLTPLEILENHQKELEYQLGVLVEKIDKMKKEIENEWINLSEEDKEFIRKVCSNKKGLWSIYKNVGVRNKGWKFSFSIFIGMVNKYANS